MQSTGVLPKFDELREKLLGSDPEEAQENFGTLIDMLVMIYEGRENDENPDAVALYMKLFGNDDRAN